MSAALQRAAIQGAVVLAPANLFYLTGWRPHAYERTIALLLEASGREALLVPTLEAEHAKTTGVAEILAVADGENPWQLVAQWLHASGLRVLGVEKHLFTLANWEALQARLSQVVAADVTPLITTLRRSKEAAEVARIQEAARIADQGIAAGIAALKPGVTERFIAHVIEVAMIDAGAEGPSFATTVLFGPDAALPHGETGERVAQAGDAVVLDIGALYKGYASDITRTVFVGEADALQRQVYETVRAAQQAGRAALRAGISGEHVDRIARQVIVQAGFGEAFTHRLGHGLGIDIHEPPYLVAGNADPLQAGDVVTVEPGIYLPGRFGVRIEDDFLVTETGAQVLTQAPYWH
ncbi:MAG: aminopeptidase P family protein [Firmicutes bacterium]|nr:aminopeptidase P family protein [Bacillota bacterium]